MLSVSQIRHLPAGYSQLAERFGPEGHEDAVAAPSLVCFSDEITISQSRVGLPAKLASRGGEGVSGLAGSSTIGIGEGRILPGDNSLGKSGRCPDA